MKIKIFFIIFTLLVAFPSSVIGASGDIVITEIGAYEASDHEWIEIYNRGGNSVDITGWKFFEEGTNHGLTTYRGDLIIESSEYAIIADIASNFEIDYSAFKGTIIDSSWSILKETGEAIALKDASGTTLESFTYLSAPDGSLERLDPNLPDYSSANWKERVGGNTAGFPNSATQNESGISNLESGTSQPTDSPSPSPQTNPVPPPSYSAGTVVINELMPDPGEDAAEWIEILNKSGDTVIDLTGWTLEDAIGKIFEFSGEISPGAFRVAELSATRLNNTGDMIKLVDPRGKIIDQVTYGGFDDGDITNNAPKTKFPNTIARKSNGIDTDKDNNDFFISTVATKGSANNFGTSGANDETADVSMEEETTVILVASSTFVKAKTQNTSNSNALVSSAIEDSVESDATSTVLNKAGVGYLRGVVTTPPGILGSQVFYIQNQNGGYEVYMFKKDFPELDIGDEVVVSGVWSSATYGRRLKVSKREDINILNHDQEITEVELSSDELSTDNIANLVKVTGDTLEIQGNNKFVLIDESGNETLIYLKSTAGIDFPELKEGDSVTVTGIFLPTKSGSRILPRFQEDIEGGISVQKDKNLDLGRVSNFNKSQVLKIIILGLGVSGVGVATVGFKFKDKIFSWRKREEVHEEVVDLDKFDI